MAIQRQIETKFVYDDPAIDEAAVCPFCHVTVTGKWEGEYLSSVSTCRHFRGFIGGFHLAPTAFFEGLAADLQGEAG